MESARVTKNVCLSLVESGLVNMLGIGNFL